MDEEHLEADDQAEKQSGDCACCLHYAVGDGRAEDIEALVSRGCNVDSRRYDDRTPLDIAIETKDTESVRVLLALGADAKASNEYGDSVLISAAYGGNADILRMLIDAGGDPNAVHPGSGTTLLHAAVSLERGAAVSELLKRGADTNAKNNEGQTPMDVAKAGGIAGMFRLARINSGEAPESVDDMSSAPISLEMQQIIDVLERHINGPSEPDVPTASRKGFWEGLDDILWGVGVLGGMVGLVYLSAHCDGPKKLPQPTTAEELRASGSWTRASDGTEIILSTDDGKRDILQSSTSGNDLDIGDWKAGGGSITLQWANGTKARLYYLKPLKIAETEIQVIAPSRSGRIDETYMQMQ